MMSDNSYWPIKYAPKTFDELILNEEIRPKLKKALDEVPNIILFGAAGVGKGSWTNVLLDATGYDKMWVNASDETGIDVVREKITQFAHGNSLTPLKICVLNEADSLTSTTKQAAQKSLKQLMEDVAKHCRFVMLTNNINDIIPEIRSRCWVINVCAPPIAEIGKYCLKILREEGVEYKAKDVADICKKCYPDIRRTVEVLHENTFDGNLTGSSLSMNEDLWNKILDLIKKKDVDDIRKELKSNYIDYPDLYKFLYENVGVFKQPGAAVLEIGEHLHRHSTYPIPEINFMRMVMSFIYQKII
jgi:replication factor C small subunit